MKIAITATGKDLDSNVDPRFGRAMYFIVIDPESGDFEVLPNEQNLNAAQGAGIQAAQTVVRNKAEVVLSGRIGPKAYDTLTAAGIKVISWDSGSVSQAIEMIKTDQLKPADGANMQGHWK